MLTIAFRNAGGSLVKRLKVGDVIHGQPSGMVLGMDFDSQEAIRGMFTSDEHASVLPARDRGFREMKILVNQSL